ncbi:MAG: YggS family pyridoxal phosphate-dependent enzyme [Bacteroidales bacterium]|nr:YggS family pyridoxal phosphate-dependent enzyme [Bacteroidales bacterium]
MNIAEYHKITTQLPATVRLVAVSKTKPKEDIQVLYDEGQRVFGENKALEMKDKYENLPKDIEWHFIGHLQSNKIKYIAPFVSLIHSIDSYELLKEVNKYAVKNQRVLDCLIQFHIATEESKFGFNISECEAMLNDADFGNLTHINSRGVMGMASFTDDKEQVRKEFAQLQNYFRLLKDKYFNTKSDFTEISMGMSEDYPIAIEEGSTLIRVGSAIFGARNYAVKNNSNA